MLRWCLIPLCLLLPFASVSQWFASTHDRNAPLGADPLHCRYHPSLIRDSTSKYLGIYGVNQLGRNGVSTLEAYSFFGKRMMLSVGLAVGGGSNRWTAQLGHAIPLTEQLTLGWRTGLVRTEIASEGFSTLQVEQLVELGIQFSANASLAAQVILQSDRPMIQGISWHGAYRIGTDWAVYSDFLLPESGSAFWVVGGIYGPQKQRIPIQLFGGLNLMSQNAMISLKYVIQRHTIRLHQGIHPHLGSTIGLGYESVR